MTNTIYKNLKDRFATFDELKAWFATEEGGRLTVRDNASPLAMIHYVKELSNMSAPHVEYFRSVIWNKETNTPVCAAPCRGRKFNDAVDNAVAINECVVEEFIDGVMINMFWHGDDWHLATRTQLGAHCRYYSSDTCFDELFWMAFRDNDLTTDMLDKTVCYSWVLQHPKERIVVSPTHGIPRICMVEASRISADGTHTLVAVSAAAGIPTPSCYMLASLEAVKEHVVTWGRRLGHQYQGVVIKKQSADAEGVKRWKLRTNQYDEARHLRGNHANRNYRWLELWSEGKLGKYLRVFPEEDADANGLIYRYKANTQELHRRYVEIYRDRRYPLGEAPHKFRKLLWELHQKGDGAYFPSVRDFMNSQDTARKLWVINYASRYGTAHNPAPLAKRQPQTEPAAASSE